jgi:hypothetical protein
MQTKQDFPTIMTRGRVTENRIDIELEKQGSILHGRNEKQRKKDAQKEHERQMELKDEQRLRNELEESYGR